MAKPTIPYRKITANPSRLIDCPPATERTRLGNLHKIEEGQSDMNMMSSINMLDAMPIEEAADLPRLLADQLARLDDTALKDPDDYPWAWIEEVRETGATVMMEYDKEGRKSLRIGCSCDEHLEDRLRRTRALSAHMLLVNGAREQIIRIIERQRPSMAIDYRPRDLRKTVAVLRAFLETGHRLFIDLYGRVETGASVPREWLTADVPRMAVIENAARDFFELRRKFSTERYLKRIIRSLGKLHEGSGCIVLDGDVA
ncbi:hypothetical protein [Sphingobium indicum]